jgi:hypothetical protein
LREQSRLVTTRARFCGEVERVLLFGQVLDEHG